MSAAGPDEGLDQLPSVGAGSSAGGAQVEWGWTVGWPSRSSFPHVVLGSAPIRRRSLTELNVRVLRALEPSLYQTIDAVTELLGVQGSVTRAELTRLRDQGLAEDNGEHPLAFRRTVLGDEALKWFG
jgi:hypothetical protein